MKNILVLLAIALTAMAIPVNAEQVVRIDIPANFVLPKTPCTASAIAFTGQAQAFLNITVNENSAHIKAHVNAQGISGFDADGNKYQLNGAANAEVNINGLPPFVAQVNVNANLVGQGQAGDARLHLVFHVTVNPNGEVTAEFFKVDAECK